MVYMKKGLVERLVKKRELKDIKNGEKIMLTLVLSARGSESFSEIQSKTGLDRKAVQKGLADLQKAGFVSKNDQSFWTITPGTALSEIYPTENREELDGKEATI